jgi:hypothetical protein
LFVPFPTSYNPTQGYGPQSRKWCFTLNNPTMSGDELGTDLRDRLAKAYVFQKEAAASGTEHYQGVVEFKSPVAGATVAKYFRWHTEVCRDWDAAQIYCSKSDTRVAGPWVYGCKIPEAPEVPYVFRLETFRPWQTEVIKMIEKEPDDRTIHWYADAIGGSGKTTLCKHIVSNMGPAIYVQGKAADVKAGIVLLPKKPRIVLFGVTRSQEGFFSYEALESVKDGIFFSGKYESGMVVYKPPWVLVFANFKPELDKLSKDRWVIHDMTPAFSEKSVPLDPEAGGYGGEY